MPTQVTTMNGSSWQPDAFDESDRYNANTNQMLLQRLLQNSAAQAGIAEQRHEFDTSMDPTKNPELDLETAQTGALKNHLALQKSFAARAAAGDPTLFGGISDPQSKAALQIIAGMDGDLSSAVPQIMQQSNNRVQNEFTQAHLLAGRFDPASQARAQSLEQDASSKGGIDSAGGLLPNDPSVVYGSPGPAQDALMAAKAHIKQFVGAEGNNTWSGDPAMAAQTKALVDAAVQAAHTSGNVDPAQAQAYVNNQLNYNDPDLPGDSGRITRTLLPLGQGHRVHALRQALGYSP